MESKPLVDKPSAPTPVKLDPVTLLSLQVNHLKMIEGHLKSIRSMLNFFVVVIVLTAVLQACSVITTLLGL